MGAFSWVHWLIVLLVVMLLFGAGRISGLMGDLGKGIKSFKKGLAEDDEAGTGPGTAQPTPRITDDRGVDSRTTVTQPAADLDKR